MPEDTSTPLGFNSEEEYERFTREVLIPRYEAMKADPTLSITIEQLQQDIAEWHREDAPQGAEVLKRSA